MHPVRNNNFSLENKIYNGVRKRKRYILGEEDF